MESHVLQTVIEENRVPLDLQEGTLFLGSSDGVDKDVIGDFV